MRFGIRTAVKIHIARVSCRQCSSSCCRKSQITLSDGNRAAAHICSVADRYRSGWCASELPGNRVSNYNGLTDYRRIGIIRRNRRRRRGWIDRMRYTSRCAARKIGIAVVGCRQRFCAD